MCDMISKGFEIVQNGLYGTLASKGFELVPSKSENDNVTFAVFKGTETAYKIEYSEETKKFLLLRADVVEGEIDENNYAVLETHLLEDSSDEGDANFLAADFIESIESKTVIKKSRAALTAQARKEKENDETGIIFFVNRFPSVLPELRDPLIRHKEHFGNILPINFCEQCVNEAVLKMMRDGENQKMSKFFTLLSDMYKNGDLEVKSVIVQTVLKEISNPDHILTAESYMSDELIKAWRAGKRYYGKNVKPEKASLTQKLLSGEGDRLTDR